MGTRVLRLASDYRSTAPGLLDFLQGRFPKYMSMAGDSAGQVGGSQHFEAGTQLLYNTQLEQPDWIELIAFQQFQPADVHDSVFLAENIREPAFGQTPMQRHLSAFKPSHDAVTGHRLGALCAAARILTAARAHALSDALFFLLLSSRRPEFTEIHVSPPRLLADAESFSPCPGSTACRAAPRCGSWSSAPRNAQ